MIHLRIAVAVIFSLMLTACGKDFLDRKPQGQPTTVTFFTDSVSAAQSVNAVYDILRDFQVHANAFVSIVSITSDDADKGSTAGDGPAQKDMDNFTVNAANNFVNVYWGGLYRGIERCNVVLANVPGITMGDGLRNRLIAEARCLRGYFYFCLVRTYGAVPLADKLLTPDTYNLPRSSVDSIYNFIIKDLEAAAAVLPRKSAYKAADLGRVTQGAAQGLLAKVWLYRKNWQAVVTLTDAVIASGEYDLSTPYDKIFTQAGENGRESVFEVQCVADPQMLGAGQYTRFQGIRSQTLNLGYGFNIPSTTLLSAYEAGDPRKAATVLTRGETTGAGEIVPADAISVRYNKKAYVPPAERPLWDMTGGGQNIRLLRYADILLMQAEAANELGQPGKALTALNAVRQRARGSNPATVLPDITTTDQTALREHIRQERHIELALEHDRFYDLVRWGIVETVMKASGKTGFTKNKNELMPVPQTEIDKSNGILTQNQGYN